MQVIHVQPGSNGAQVDPPSGLPAGAPGLVRLAAMSAADSVLRVALPVPLPRLFDYRPPADGPGAVGCRVRVPFGSRSLVGVIVETGPPDPGLAELREAEAVLDPHPLLHG